MLKKIWTIFRRDTKVSIRDYFSIMLWIYPLVLAVAINIFVPSVNEISVNLALLENENTAQLEYLEQFAKVELFEDIEAIEQRVEKRDDIFGIIPEGNSYYILSQGDEIEELRDYAKILNIFYELDIQIEDTNAELIEFGVEESSLKKILVNMVILMLSIMGGMLIALNIIEEKMDKTIRAVNVSPISRNSFIIGKSIIALLLSFIGAIVILLITGFADVNWGQILLAVGASSIISLLIGFIQGIKNDDIMSAVASIKLLFMPLAVSVAGIELLADKWHWLLYWSPFYWTYKAYDAVLSYSGTWLEILFYVGMTLVLSVGVYIYLAPKIKKGLQ